MPSTTGWNDPNVGEYFSHENPNKKFNILREIGHGSFGAVYFARNKSNSQAMAIKKMSFNGKNSEEKWQEIIKEISFLRSCSHKNIIEYYGCYLVDDYVWLSMEYCIGSAADIVEVHKDLLHENEVAAICIGTLEGLRYLHSTNRIHRDVKAGNVLLTSEGVVKLGDFGSASLKCPATTFVGSPYWMAPEVILSMDEGPYDGKADVWSLGITCIELAERKPPLINMNAMSALYHIAQNDPPTLKESPRWSVAFVSFVAKCLNKDAKDRPSTEDLMLHEFVTQDRPAHILFNLIQRTKEAVRTMDSLSYKRLKKIVIEESEQTNINSQPATEQQRNGPTMPHIDHDSDDDNSSQSSSNIAEISDRSMNEPVRENESSEDRDLLGQDRFATIRPISFVSRERREHASHNNYREQLLIYTRMRQQHQHQLQSLNAKLTSELHEQIKQLDKDHESFLHGTERELERIRNKHKGDLEQNLRACVTEEKKYWKTVRDKNEQEMKQFNSQQKADFKIIKTSIKKELDEMSCSSKDRETMKRKKLDEVLQRQSEDERRKLQELRNGADLKLRQFRKEQLLCHHNLEKQLLQQELNFMQQRKDQSHETLQRHLEIINDTESKHMKVIQDLRLAQQQKQHRIEWDNENEYERQRRNEQRKKQLIAQRQQPRNLKTQKDRIKRQFADMVKTQNRQFKSYEKQLLQREPREKHREISKQLKEERNRKMAALEEQYDKTIVDLVEEQASRLTESQTIEQQALERMLQQEKEMLSAYQSRMMIQMKTQNEKERTECEEKITNRRKEMDSRKMEESMALQQLRLERQQELQQRHQYELNFFKESLDASLSHLYKSSSTSSGIRNFGKSQSFMNKKESAHEY
ncbi:uncharacterized protein TRIADDRAFT_30095 [Trichoplax adhaerens]|uniref:non-specific serine/threonine protein kinase n=1 Tax=Trichoplax adhaerens TaxID=10228 RepID=B3S6A2_TRIAD|nr:hypothetical protein TRIADDRAFT_30095 [Trichoplax adhaerens]EDV21721.1 hypothetical protein TRIADDRAFT_30095 [Trichoplax adhaerens]|eukprot:XP_002115869.1 hypothetical protein TRIADDRAFT_30095 [Trichoplax adhaerens]